MAKKTRYARSTPVIRLRRNISKISLQASIVLDRLNAWKSSANDRVLTALAEAQKIWELAKTLDGQVEALESAGFVPPRRVDAYQPAAGDRVAIAEKFRARYDKIYEGVMEEDPNFLDDLMVRSLQPTGDVVVQRGKRTPFAVRKSHIVRV